MADKYLTPEDVARHLEELQRTPPPVDKPDDAEPEDPRGGAGVPAPLKPLVPSLSGGNARQLPDPPEAEQRAA